MVDFKKILDEERKPPILLVDGNYILHRCLHTPDLAAMKTSTGTPTGGIFGFFSSLRKSLESYSDTRRVIVAWDTGRSPRRLELLPEYKANRQPKDEDEREESERYKAVFDHQVGLIKQNLPRFGVRQVALPSREGDDLIGLICKLYPRRKKTIVTDDKDMLQLVNRTTSVFRPIREEEVTFLNFEEKTGSENPSKFIVAKSILGDKSDNIDGVPKVGKKTVQDLLEVVNRQVSEQVGDVIDKFVSACARMPRTKKGALLARFKGVLEGVDRIKRNVDLIDISRESFSEKEVEAVRFYCEGGKVSFSHDNSIAFFSSLEFNTFIKTFSVCSRLFGELT